MLTRERTVGIGYISCAHDPERPINFEPFFLGLGRRHPYSGEGWDAMHGCTRCEDCATILHDLEIPDANDQPHLRLLR